jgi:hypothetical protein
MPIQKELFAGDGFGDSLLDRIEAMPFAVRKIYVDIIRFVYYGILNCSNNPEKIPSRYKLKPSSDHLEVLLWDRDVLKWLHTERFISDANDVILINPSDTDMMKHILKMYSSTHLDKFRHCVASDPARLLDDLTKDINVGSVASPKRSCKLLRPFDAQSTDSWAFCVPRCFNDALDIKFSENKFNTVSYAIWTQGSSFAFQRNDIIFDKPKGDMRWGDFLSMFRYCIHIDSASPAMPSEKESSDEETPYNNKARKKVIKTNPGSVTFTIKTPNDDKTGLVKIANKTMTQADFVKLLIVGIGKD